MIREGGKSITRIPACMSKYTNLKFLEFIDTGITRIENLDGLVKLEEIWLGGAPLTRIENLDTLVNLNVLDLDSTNVSRIENLDTLVNLKTLGLDGTKVSDEEKRAFATRTGVDVG